MNARERLETLFEPGTFQEFGMHAQHSCHRFGMEKKQLPYDGVVCGSGLIDGRAVAAYAQDFTVSGGSLGRIHAKKICDLMDFALESGMPVVGVNDSGGARIQEGVDSLSGYGQVFFKNFTSFGSGASGRRHCRPLCRWCGLFAGFNRLPNYDQGELQHVYLRSRCN